jgi:hypothetical protein
MYLFVHLKIGMLLVMIEDFMFQLNQAYHSYIFGQIICIPIISLHIGNHRVIVIFSLSS